MIILHFDLQPQFKYMTYFIYTSYQKHRFTEDQMLSSLIFCTGIHKKISSANQTSGLYVQTNVGKLKRNNYECLQANILKLTTKFNSFNSVRESSPKKSEMCEVNLFKTYFIAFQLW